MKHPITGKYISFGNKGTFIHNNLTLKIKEEKVTESDVFTVLFGKQFTDLKCPYHQNFYFLI